jgi:uncharacterized membrane protein
MVDQHGIRRALWRPPTFGGLFGGTLVWLLSLLPSLLPRGAMTQAVVGGICAALGYAVGTLVQGAAGLVADRLDRRPPPELVARAWSVLRVAAAVAVVAGPIVWAVGQERQLDLLGLPAMPAGAVVPMLLGTVVVVALLVVIGRLVGHATTAVDRSLTRTMPPLVARALAVALIGGSVVVVTRDVVLDGFLAWANSTYGTFDESTPDGVAQPRTATVSGGPASAVPWDTLGYYGRGFAGTATTADVLTQFWGDDARMAEPVRAYVGLESADGYEAQAALAVEELERLGGFDREVLCIVSTTGTGWVNPDAASALEVLHGGDTAIVAMQYSYLPSWISFLVDVDKASQSADALTTAVHERWAQLPEDDRPRLLLYGESLGSLGAERALAGPDAAASIDALRSTTDGVLLVGPTATNPIWQQVTDARDEGSPVWEPVHGGGREVRLAVQGTPELGDAPDWSSPRVLWLHHPNDPVGQWTWSTLWSPPAWTERPRGPGVSDAARWVPVVGFVQGVADLAAGFSTPPGQGHDYEPDLAGGWAAVAAPEGWTPADTTRLAQFLAALPPSPVS